MQEVMNRIAPESMEEPLVLPDEFNQIREQALEGLVSSGKRSQAGRSDSAIGTSIAPSSISETSEQNIINNPRSRIERLKEYSKGLPKSFSEKTQDNVLKTENVEPLDVAEKEGSKPAEMKSKAPSQSGKSFVSKKGLLSGKSKLFRFIGPQEQFKFSSKENKNRAEEIANSFKSKFAQGRISRGRRPAEGTVKYNEQKDKEQSIYNEMIGEFKSENLLSTETQKPENPQNPESPETKD